MQAHRRIGLVALGALMAASMMAKSVYAYPLGQYPPDSQSSTLDFPGGWQNLAQPFENFWQSIESVSPATILSFNPPMQIPTTVSLNTQGLVGIVQSLGQRLLDGIVNAFNSIMASI